MFERLVKTLEVESRNGEKCETCRNLSRCLAWWDTVVDSTSTKWLDKALKDFDIIKMEVK